MLADAHRQAAEENEQLIADAGDPAIKPYAGRGIIELYWGAAFHWIAFGCQQKHGKHKENHSHLVSFLRDMGELTNSNTWDALDKARNGGWYGHHNSLIDVQETQQYWQEIRTWALT
ncbi:MAG TPA: hypothetical protein VIG30_00240 [Ktedonobacterales bacterium]|jgi:hypothetical protein